MNDILRENRGAKIKGEAPVGRTLRKWDLEKRRQNKRVSNRRYYLKNKESYQTAEYKNKHREYKKKWRADNKDKIREERRRYRAIHGKEIYQKRKEKLKIQLKVYHKQYYIKYKQILDKRSAEYKKNKKRYENLLKQFPFEYLKKLAGIIFRKYQAITNNRYRLSQDKEDILLDLILYALQKIKDNCMTIQKGKEGAYVYATMKFHLRMLAHRKYEHTQHEFLVDTNDKDYTMEDGLNYLNLIS